MQSLNFLPWKVAHENKSIELKLLVWIYLEVMSSNLGTGFSRKENNISRTNKLSWWFNWYVYPKVWTEEWEVSTPEEWMKVQEKNREYLSQNIVNITTNWVLVWLGFMHINPCRLFDAKSSSYILYMICKLKVCKYF